MRLWVCTLLLHHKHNSLTGIGGKKQQQCFASPALPRPPVEQVRQASYVWSPETYKDIQAQFMNISRYVPELHNIVTPSIAFLSQHPTPPHPTPLSLPCTRPSIQSVSSSSHISPLRCLYRPCCWDWSERQEEEPVGLLPLWWRVSAGLPLTPTLFSALSLKRPVFKLELKDFYFLLVQIFPWLDQSQEKAFLLRVFAFGSIQLLQLCGFTKNAFSRR